jgi:ribonuclease E/ribonuclease G
MTIELVVDRAGDTLALAILDQGALIDLWSVDAGPAAVEDRLFLARITGIEPAVDGAFLDHGGAQAGYITGKDARFRRGLSKKVSIRHCLEDGEWLVVQGLRAAEGDKGARFTTDLRLQGPHLVYRPYDDEITAARGIRPADREAATALGQALLENTRTPGGLVVRRSAMGRDEAVLAAELQDLAAAWQRLSALPRDAGRKAGPLAWGPSPLARLLWRALELGPVRLVVADDALKAEARRLLEALAETGRPALEALSGKAGAFAATGVDAALAEAMAREIPLPGGGRLIVEETAACVAIDVDGGGRPALEVDLEAAAVIGRLVRLRNLGGTLVVDFVDLTGKAQRQRLEDALKRAFRGDPLPVQIYPMSPLGIVQISRAKRGGQPLRALGRLCPTCGGSGWTAG